jgi:DNA (cytosine-5)-methyltransferase 1
MRYVSLFSGIEAATVAWEPLGWEPVAFAEIEPFPCAVLAYRFPDVPNLGDVTKIDWSKFIERNGSVDLVCGGSPCQGFSVAGLRKGLNDPRGNLMLEFLRAVDEIKPEFVLWENVPGVLSDKTHAFDVLLESLQDLGYMIDADILDAQYFGLAQRRKRVFVLGWRVETLLKKRTDLSKKITEQCLLQILQSVLGVLYLESEKGCVDSNCKDRLKDGLTKKMRLFDLHTADNFEMLLKSLVDAPQKYQAECKNLVSDLGKIFKDIPDMANINLDLEPTESAKSLIEKSWKIISEDGLSTEKQSTISTSTKTITQSKICTCLIVVLLIARLMPRSKPSEPIFSNEESSISTNLKEFIKYAEQKSERPTLFDESDDVLVNLCEQARKHIEAFGVLGDAERAAEILFERESLRWDYPSSRDQREELAGTAEHGAAPSIDAIAFDTTQITSPQNGSNPQFGDPCHPLCAAGHSPAVAYAMRMRAGKPGGGKGPLVQTDVSGTLATGNDRTIFQPICMASANSNAEIMEDCCTTQTARQYKDPPILVYADDETPMVLYEGVYWTVRRLMPIECERLQGFSDDWTKIPYRNKDADKCPDGPRYKALGNSWAVPCARWIGERIERMEKWKMN